MRLRKITGPAKELLNLYSVGLQGMGGSDRKLYLYTQIKQLVFCLPDTRNMRTITRILDKEQEKRYKQLNKLKVTKIKGSKYAGKARDPQR